MPGSSLRSSQIVTYLIMEQPILERERQSTEKLSSSPRATPQAVWLQMVCCQHRFRKGPLPHIGSFFLVLLGVPLCRGWVPAHGHSRMSPRMLSDKALQHTFSSQLNFAQSLEPWFSKYGPWTSNNNLHRKLDRNANSWAPPQTSGTLGQGTSWILMNSLCCWPRVENRGRDYYIIFPLLSEQIPLPCDPQRCWKWSVSSTQGRSREEDKRNRVVFLECTRTSACVKLFNPKHNPMKQ